MSDRRDEILRAARMKFAEQGVKATTVRQIGVEAGMLSGSLYHHFSSKQDIVDAILQEFQRDIMSRYRELHEAPVDPVEKLRGLVRHGFTMIVQHPAAVRIVQSDLATLRNLDRFAYLDEMTAEIQRIWMSAVFEGIRMGVFRPTTEPYLVFRVVFDTVAHAVRWFHPNGPMSITTVADQVSDMLLLGVRTSRAGAGRDDAGLARVQ